MLERTWETPIEEEEKEAKDDEEAHETDEADESEERDEEMLLPAPCSASRYSSSRPALNAR